MKLSPLALAALPVALSLAACSGGSSGFINNNIGTGGQQANLRFVYAAPDLGTNIDIYFQATGAAAPTAPAAGSSTNVSYATVTPFISESPVAGTVTVRTAGSSASGPALASLACPIPQMAVNAKYTVSISGTAATGYSCLMFQDFDYTTAPQYRVHNASASAASTLAYNVAGTSTAPGTPVAFVSSQVAARGGNAATPGAVYTQVQPAGPIPASLASSNPSFVIGPNTGAATFPVLDSLNASALFASGSHSQPDTAGTLNFPSTAGTSVFAIDCTPAAVASLPGVQCNSSVALIGTFDTL